MNDILPNIFRRPCWLMICSGIIISFQKNWSYHNPWTGEFPSTTRTDNGKTENQNLCLVGGLEHADYVSIQLGITSSQHIPTDELHHFSEGSNHQPDVLSNFHEKKMRRHTKSRKQPSYIEVSDVMGVPLVLLHFRLGFSMKWTIQLLRIPQSMETTIWRFP